MKMQLLGFFLVIISITNYTWADTPIFDPTQPSSYHEQFAEVGAMGLTSIYFAKDCRYAIINDAIVKEGDVISGETVVAIEQNTVTLMDTQKRKQS